jgi:hypothetical protein
VIWGALHGAYVVINHLMRRGGSPDGNVAPSFAATAGKRIVTLLIVMIAWVFFRAKTVAGALSVLGSMAFLGPRSQTLETDNPQYFWLILAGGLALFAPNTQQLTHYTAKLTETLKPRAEGLLASIRAGRLRFGATPATALLCGVLFAGALACIWRPAIFIYFNF